jgi:hypothetical protein
MTRRKRRGKWEGKRRKGIVKEEREEGKRKTRTTNIYDMFTPLLKKVSLV